MMFRVALGFIVLISSFAGAQTFVVKQVKSAQHRDGSRMRVADSLSIKSTFRIARGGELKILFDDHFEIPLKGPGNFRLDTIYARLIHDPTYFKHDKIFKGLRENKIYPCHFNNQLESSVSNLENGATIFRTFESGRVRVTFKDHIKTTDTMLPILWEVPEGYNGSYFIITENIFGDYLDLFKADENSFEMDLARYRDEKYFFFKVVTAECRESKQFLVRLD